MSKQILPFIPEEIIADRILTRLPVKSVGRFRCVSKSWRSLLSSSRFARAHLNFYMDHHEPGGTVLAEQDIHSGLVTLKFATESSSTNVTVPFAVQDAGSALVGSCHGLVLVQLEKENKINGWNLNLFNPITLECMEIPNFVSCRICIYGLGYDSSQDDYKIVYLSRDRRGTYEHVGIYSVRMQTWRILGNSPYAHYDEVAGEFVNGCIHWLAMSKEKAKVDLVAFNCAREEFEDLTLPSDLDDIGFFGFKLAVLGGYLTLVYAGHGNSSLVKFWVMKEYGARDSWTEFSIRWPENVGNRLSVVGVLEEEEYFWGETGEKLVAYNWRSQVWRNIVFDGIFIRTFRPSLISPKMIH